MDSDGLGLHTSTLKQSPLSILLIYLRISRVRQSCKNKCSEIRLIPRAFRMFFHFLNESSSFLDETMLMNLASMIVSAVLKLFVSCLCDIVLYTSSYPICYMYSRNLLSICWSVKLSSDMDSYESIYYSYQVFFVVVNEIIQMTINYVCADLVENTKWVPDKKQKIS